jgi:hypothetical protein
MSFPPIRRQSGMINVRDALKTEANPLEAYKDAKYHKPFHGEIVSGWDGASFVRCKYDHIKKIWISHDDKSILQVEMWSTEVKK